MAPHRQRIVQLADVAALANRACDEVLQVAHASIAERGWFRIALAGGSTPKLLYSALGGQAARADFAHWQVFFGDERNVPPDHRDSNFGMANESWLVRGQIPAAQIHRIQGELDAFKAAAEYERELAHSFGTREAPRFDLILLGMGPDGHTASLFPGSSAVDESRLFVASTWVEKFSAHRITLTLRTINAARTVFFLVAGEDKAETLRDVLLERGDPKSLPARRVRPWNGAVAWFVDRAAAARLSAGD